MIKCDFNPRLKRRYGPERISDAGNRPTPGAWSLLLGRNMDILVRRNLVSAPEFMLKIRKQCCPGSRLVILMRRSLANIIRPERTSFTQSLWSTRMQSINHSIEQYKANGMTHADALSTPIAKRMAESYVEGILPFSSDQDSREDYMNTYGGVRIAKLLEDLDALSGAISYLHADDANHCTLPLAIVTATVDRIDLLNSLEIDRDLRLSGHVSYVGFSSMEVTIRVESVLRAGETHPDALDGMVPIMLSRFTMVARNPSNGKAQRVNTLALSSQLEHDVFEYGRQGKEMAKHARRTDLSKTAPTADESALIHATWAKNFEIEDMTPKLRADTITPRMTQLSRAVITHPSQRNLGGNAFGGYLLAQAFDLAFITANLHLEQRPRFLSSSQLTFQTPVPIGSILEFRARIVAQDESKFTVTVTADKIESKTRERTTTSIFHYTFSRLCKIQQKTEGSKITLPSNQGDQICGRNLVAETYGDALRYIAARRREAHSISREDQLRFFHKMRLPKI